MKSDQSLSPTDQKTVEDGNVKINVSPNIPCTFLLVHLFKFSFPEKRVFSFPLLDKWNVNKSGEKVKFYSWKLRNKKCVIASTKIAYIWNFCIHAYSNF